VYLMLVLPRLPVRPAAALVLLWLVSVPVAAADRWTLHETARHNGHRQTRLPDPAARPASAEIGRPLTADPGRSYQTMVGFGGALTESSAWVLAQLPPTQRLEVIRRYYDPQEGIGYTLARTHINSCDFSLHLWALADVPGDYDLHHFTLDPMRRWLMPLLHDARRVAGAENFRLLASPWSPPAWMKTNNRMDDGGTLRREHRPAWAQYYVRFVEAMAREEGLPIWGLTVQNEPEAHQSWESCLLGPEDERDFIRSHLGPALHAAGLAAVKLIGWDHNRDRLEVRADALLGDPATARYLWGLGLHWYAGSDYAVSARVQARYPDKPILFTEGCYGAGAALGAWEHGEGYARQMIGDFRNWVCGYIDWNIVLDHRGGPNHVGNFCDAPVLVDTRTKEVRYGPSFHYIAHFSRFVRPGAQRIGLEGGPEALGSVAFRNPDDSLVMIILNESDSVLEFALAVPGETIGATIPAHAIQTYVRRAPPRQNVPLTPNVHSAP
jgi:glucosylceramidase